VYDFLTGTVAAKHGDAVVLDVGGVGYACFVSLNTLSAVPPRGETITLLVHLVVREDQLSLYGFTTALERELFRRLISVSGVGPKVAMALLSGTTPEVLVDAIETGNVSRLKAVKGVGPKTAQRIVVDLGDYVHRRRDLVTAPDDRQAPFQVQEEAVAALTALGFTERSAVAAIEKVLKRSPDASVETLVREALGAAS